MSEHGHAHAPASFNRAFAILFFQSLHLMFDGVPGSVDPAAVQSFLRSQPGVDEMPDLLVRAMSTSDFARTEPA